MPWGNETTHETDLEEVAQPIHIHHLCATSPTSGCRGGSFTPRLARRLARRGVSYVGRLRRPPHHTHTQSAWGKNPTQSNLAIKDAKKNLTRRSEQREQWEREPASFHIAESRTNMCEANPM